MNALSQRLHWLALPALTLGLAGLAFPALSQDSIAKANVNAKAGYWTSERLRKAVPMAVRIPSVPMKALLDEAGHESLSEEALSGEGAYPSADDEIEPDRANRLFPAGSKPADDAIAVPKNVGTEGAYFSSSRLIPTDARLTYPYRPNGKLFLTKPGVGDSVCSAAVIQQRLVVTAGHCVHSGGGGNKGFFENFLFVPAYHKGEAPYGEWDWRWVVTTEDWANSNGEVPNRSDFAILQVDDQRFRGKRRKIGEVTGWLGWRTNSLYPNHTKKIGYPTGLDRGEVQHQVDSESHERAAESTVLYGSDMTGGSSGGAWIANFGVKATGQTHGTDRGPNRVVGITSYGFRNQDGSLADLLVQGSSTLNDSWIEIFDRACSRRSGNCSP